jgi:rod shape-determining protein MreC
LNPFNFDLRKIILLLLLLPLPLISINMEQKPFESNWLSQPFSLLATSVQEVFYGFSEGVRGTTGMYLNLINIKKESEELKSKNQELQARLQQMADLEIENSRLKDLFEFKRSTKMEMKAAQVIARDLVADHNTITINKGTMDGVKSGQAVISVQGVLGYVFRPTLHSSNVMLITDRYAVVDGIIQRTRTRGIVEGRSLTSLGMAFKYVEKAEDIKAGDVVVTGGLDNIFPKGFPIATVESVEKKTFAVSPRIDLKPVADPYKVEEVFVITNAKEEDLGSRFTVNTEVPQKADPKGNVQR